MRFEKEVREFQLEMLKVQLRHEERIAVITALFAIEIASIIFYLSLIFLSGQQVTTIQFNIFPGVLGTLAMTIFLLITLALYFRSVNKKDKEIEDIRKRFIEYL